MKDLNGLEASVNEAINLMIQREEEKAQKEGNDEEFMKAEEYIKSKFASDREKLSELCKLIEGVKINSETIYKLGDIMDNITDIGLERDRAFKPVYDCMKKLGRNQDKSYSKAKKKLETIGDLPTTTIYRKAMKTINGHEKNGFAVFYQREKNESLRELYMDSGEIADLCRETLHNVRIRTSENERQKKIFEYMKKHECTREEAEESIKQEEIDKCSDRKILDVKQILKALTSEVLRLYDGKEEKFRNGLVGDNGSLVRFQKMLEQKSLIKRNVKKLEDAMKAIDAIDEAELGGAKAKEKMMQKIEARKKKEEEKIYKLEEKSKKFADKKGISEYLEKANEFREYNIACARRNVLIDLQEKGTLKEEERKELENLDKYIQEFRQNIRVSMMEKRRKKGKEPLTLPRYSHKEGKKGLEKVKIYQGLDANGIAKREEVVGKNGRSGKEPADD